MNAQDRFAALERVWNAKHTELAEQARELSAARLRSGFFAQITAKSLERTIASLEIAVEELGLECDALAWALDLARAAANE